MPGTVLYETAESVATLTLNRPERLNAITAELVGDLRDELVRAQDDDDVRVDPPARRRAAPSAPATTSAGARR